VESAASGLIAGRNAAALVRGEEPQSPPRTTAIGALAYYVSHANPANYQPTNITFGIMPPPDPAPGKSRVRKDQRKTLTAERALHDLEEWLRARGESPERPAGTGAAADHSGSPALAVGDGGRQAGE